jgi:hypothetical protein
MGARKSENLDCVEILSFQKLVFKDVNLPPDALAILCGVRVYPFARVWQADEDHVQISAGASIRLLENVRSGRLLPVRHLI